jgi:hypothetical protein
MVLGLTPRLKGRLSLDISYKKVNIPCDLLVLEDALDCKEEHA